MKKTNVISLLFLLASTQIYTMSSTANVAMSTNNPSLIFTCACQAADAFRDVVTAAADDVVALQFINVINSCIATDVTLQSQLKASVNGTLFNGKPLNPTVIEAQNAKLEANIKSYNTDISKLQKLYGHRVPNKKITDRKKALSQQQQQLKTNLAAIAANTTAANAAQANAAKVQNLIQQNQLTLLQTIESYITSFGQCYTQAGSIYGSTTIISSKYRTDMPITPNEYQQLMTALNNAASQFSSTVAIALELNDGTAQQASISNVATYINNMSPASSNFSSYVMYAVVAATTTAAILAGLNLYQGKSFNDTGNITSAATSVSNTISSVVANPQQAWTNMSNFIVDSAKNAGSSISNQIAWLSSLIASPAALVAVNQAANPATPAAATPIVNSNVAPAAAPNNNVANFQQMLMNNQMGQPVMNGIPASSNVAPAQTSSQITPSPVNSAANNPWLDYLPQ